MTERSTGIGSGATCVPGRCTVVQPFSAGNPKQRHRDMQIDLLISLRSWKLPASTYIFVLNVAGIEFTRLIAKFIIAR
jgi:hypothetical protein